MWSLCELADHGLRKSQSVIEARLVRQEAVSIGVHQLHHVERGTPEPRRRRGEPLIVTNDELRAAWLQSERIELIERMPHKFFQ